MSQSPPPAPLSLPASNPKKRPSQPSVSSQPSKKPRVQHPLRQTSFPASADSDPRVYATGARSEADGGSVTGSFTGSLQGSFAESADGKGRGRKKGRKDRGGTTSVRGGAEESVGGFAREAPGSEDEEEDDDLEDAELLGEGDEGATDTVAEKENLAVLIDAFTPEQSQRYDLFKRSKLNKPTLRRIVNQTLSQSVPPAVITTVSGFTKVFIGEMIEKARTVQGEWADTADTGALEAAEKAEAKAAELAAEKAAKDAEKEEKKIAAAEEEQAATENSEQGQSTTEAGTSHAGVDQKNETKEDEEESQTIKQEHSQQEPTTQSIAPHTPSEQQQQQPPPIPSTQSTIPDTPFTNPKQPFQLPPNSHRGPLLPCHLREALRRSKRAAEGGNVGLSGLSMNGYGAKGSHTWNVRGGGGRRLFR